MNTLLRKAVISRTPVTFCRLVAARYSVDTGSKDHIDGLVKEKNLVVFMKGTPDSPRCGFSNGVIQILQFHGVEKFDSYDVLSDEKLREGTYFVHLKYSEIAITRTPKGSVKCFSLLQHLAWSKK